MDEALIYAKNLCEELEISFEPQDESGESIYLATEVKMFSYHMKMTSGLKLSMDKLNLYQAPQNINKEFQHESIRLQASVAATDSGCKKELSRSVSLGLLKHTIESKLEDG
ncbi:uncharacterized protein TNCV_516891 [Trichonephila clavipes]|nr:uncharacterized protein TNCV_516891 [Trichonephila clavipes]